MRWGEFEKRTVATSEGKIALRTGGAGQALLLLHGFPQTHEMWRDIAPRLAEDFTVVCADLRGYGESGCPAARPGAHPYSKRTMAEEMAEVMSELGFDTFAAVGHDRGARVAYRIALDHQERTSALVALDVVPMDTAWERADRRLALGFWPWSLLAQPAPLPERLLLGAADAILDGALGGWGTPATTFDDDVRSAYLGQLRDSDHVLAICEEYRAAATVDPADDAEDRAAGRRIACPVRVLWSAEGPLGTWYDEEGGPLALWEGLCERLEGEPVAGGHFFPEENPAALAADIRDFLWRTDSHPVTPTGEAG